MQAGHEDAGRNTRHAGWDRVKQAVQQGELQQQGAGSAPHKHATDAAAASSRELKRSSTSGGSLSRNTGDVPPENDPTNANGRLHSPQASLYSFPA